MACTWGNTDCKNEGNRCFTCVTENFHYDPKNKPKYKMAKKSYSKRPGSNFEDTNHSANNDLIQGVTTRMTPNSGAGKVKGDEEIRGLIRIMEELKTQDKELAKGDKSFSMKRSWLDKLDREARAAGKEFWYLKWAYGDFEDKAYITVDQEVVMSMVYTMVEDRKALLELQHKFDIVEKQRQLAEAENVKFRAEIELLKAQLAEKAEDPFGDAYKNLLNK